MQDIIRTFELHTNIGPAICPDCGVHLNIHDDTIDRAINHVLDHGWRLLHIGAERGSDVNGDSVHHTVAILGTA